MQLKGDFYIRILFAQMKGNKMNIIKFSMADKIIGQRIKKKRKELKISQMKLADKINVTFQQIQKYESGNNKTFSIRLLQIAEALNTDITYFVQGIKFQEQNCIGDLPSSAVVGFSNFENGKNNSV